MGLFKKIFKPVAKVLDKVIPNEIKPALPYLAAFAPVFGPAGMQSFIGSTMGRRALTSGLMNIGAQLAQEGNEGDINLLSAGLGALSGAMTTPGAAETFRGAQSANVLQDANVKRTALQKAGDFGLESLAKGSEFLRPGGEIPNLFSKEGLKIATAPAATATGDVMQAEARRLEKQAAIDAALAEAEALADSGLRGDAIRNAMRSYGFFTDDEIEETVSSAGYKAGGLISLRNGGRVGFDNGGDVSFGGITEAVEKIEKEPKTFLVDKLKVTMKPGQSEMRAIIEAMYNDVEGVMPDDRKKEFYELYAPQMYRNGEMEKSEFEFIQTEILGKEMKATGGRIGFDDGGDSGIMSLIKKAKENPTPESLRELQKIIPDAVIEFKLPGDEDRQLFRINEDAIEEFLGGRTTAKDGGLMDLGGKEMDLRKGGFVPIGKKEKADDVPARLSKNEFVMTADAVRAAGGGSVNKGAKRMYNLMNTLEARA